MERNGRLKGKIAIVTGASRGIGEGIARMFADEGARVTVAARNGDRLATLAHEIEAAGGEALPIVTDVARTEDLRRMVDATVERFGGLDILVNNAAVVFFSKHMDDPDMEAEYDRVMTTNVKSVWMGIHYALPFMKARSGGSIVNIASVHAVASGGHMSAYAASKGALVAGTHALAVELAPHLIRINCLSPGRIWTDEPGGWLKRTLGPELYQEFEETFGDWATHSRGLQQPLPVAGLPEHVAYAAVWLASDEAAFTTGANILVDGGMTAVLGDPDAMHPGARELWARRPEIREWIGHARERVEQERAERERQESE